MPLSESTSLSQLEILATTIRFNLKNRLYSMTICAYWLLCQFTRNLRLSLTARQQNKKVLHVNMLIVSGYNSTSCYNRSQISWSKIWLFLHLIKYTSKISQILRTPNPYLLFFSSFSGCGVSKFVMFHYIKVAKHIWEPCCHLEADTGSWSPLIVKTKAPRANFIKSLTWVVQSLGHIR